VSGIPVWIYYAGVPVLSVFVFMGIYRSAPVRSANLNQNGDPFLLILSLFPTLSLFLPKIAGLYSPGT